jgi:DNA-binding LytR/AlgR family response regulator
MVVDDKQPAREEVTYLLKQLPEVEIVGVVASGSEAMKVLRVHTVDVVFLDIHLPESDGFRIADAIRGFTPSPYIVFATAYDEYALQAFTTQAIDYLLKPFDLVRVKRSLEKINLLMNQHSHLHHLSEHLEQIYASLHREQMLPKILVDFQGRMLLVDYKDIILAKSHDGGSLIYTEKNVYPTNMALQEVADRLSSPSFFRSHRSYIINLERVREVIPWFNGTLNLIVEGVSEQIPVSRNQAIKLRKKLGF